MRYLKLVGRFLIGFVVFMVLYCAIIWTILQYGTSAVKTASTKGLSAYQRGDYATAAKHYRRAVEIGDSCEWMLAASLIRSGRPQDVKDVYAGPAYPWARGYSVMGVAELEMGHPREALPLLVKAASEEPQTPMYHINLAIALERTGKIDTARQERAKAVKFGGTAYADIKVPLACALEQPGRQGATP